MELWKTSFKYKFNFFHFVTMDLAFRSLCSHLIVKLIFLFSENLIFYFLFKKKLGVTTYFCFIFLKENKIKNKIISVTPYLKKTICGKPRLDLTVKLPVRKVWWCAVAPL